MTRVRSWYFIKNGVGAVYPVDVKEEDDVRLYGLVYGDKRYDPITTEFKDGHAIITSPVVSINWDKLAVKTRSGSEYKLDGKANSDYEKFVLRTEDLLN